MTFHVLFWAMCAVVTAYVAVAIIAIAKAYQNERRLGPKSVTQRRFLT
jgi:anti-sigma-K factor RskA